MHTHSFVDTSDDIDNLILTLIQAGRDIQCQIKEASITNGTREDTFNEEPVYLYKVDAFSGGSLSGILYRVGNESSRLSRRFPMYEYNTTVTKEAIIIVDDSFTIALTLDADRDTFAVYDDIIPIKNFTVSMYR